ncbi:hypothetical protein AB0H43_11685 [Hamadaea sp. NPDC050747]|uniref:hypothetical protein n=1 Tax=Hamadaea sp. NPDC050747 TaxID=3155789 RepID=UPI0033E29917
MTGTSKRARVVRLGAIATALALFVGGYAAFVAVESPVAMTSVDVEAASVVSDGDGYLVRYTPSGEVLLRVTLQNDGGLPVRLTGIRAPWVPTSDPATSPPIAPFYRATAVGFDADRMTAFQPVTLRAGHAASVGLRLTMCPAGTPGTDAGRFTAHQVTLIYAYAGWERAHTEDLTQSVSAPFYKCDYAGRRP